MKKLLIVGVLGLVLLEIANVYFIMPMPGSQRMRSVDAAYTIYRWRWTLRLLFGAIALAGGIATWRTGGRRRWLVPASLALVGAVAYVVNFRMAADQMFRQPHVLDMRPAAQNTVAGDRLVVGVALNGEARAYPLNFLGYHHQVRDSVGGQPVLVSYCTVCRTGRVFSPTTKGGTEDFRLVGMDHYNAMLEDGRTGSWWRQANGEAITGTRKGEMLVEIPRLQVTLKEWLAVHPNSLVMQGDPAFTTEYAKDYAFEKGTSRKTLTGTDTLSWRDKSWVVGLTLNRRSKAYDWNRLKRERVVNDIVGTTPIVLVLAADSASFYVYQRPDATTQFTLRGDSLVAGGRSYALSGRGVRDSLVVVNASQEFWHSWREFQPSTERY